MRYIGDLSARDAQLLQTLAAGAARILEFGAGGSTQIFAQAAPAGAEIVSVETDAEWIARTQRNFALLGIQRQVKFWSWRDWERAAPLHELDLIFDDGVDKLRLDFALRAWPMLRVGGKLLFHDTRRAKDFGNVADFLRSSFLEVESVLVNTEDTNLTVVTKKLAQAWEDWNVVEKRAKWEYGHAEPPPGLWDAKAK